MRVGVFYNPFSDASVRFSEAAADWLRARGLEVWRGASHLGRENSAIECVDLVVAAGGDGTVLRAARLAERCGVPILPVALGRLNFMAELEPDTFYDGIATVLDGGGWRDERTMIEGIVAHVDGSPSVEFLALNEIVVARRDINRIINVDVRLYDSHLTTYHADGVIVSTATGSTAYALSAGGPIVDPRSRNIILVPIAAHMTSIKSLVLDDDATMQLTLRGRHSAAVYADGDDHHPMQEGDTVTIKRSNRTCTFARVYPPSSFYARMTQRLRRD
ncbi:MAG: NAD(+)/NADH kinase [Chloroflexi bacterium]|nr:NAD(+)/NADH kinase [Chloroflexota bacterium]